MIDLLVRLEAEMMAGGLSTALFNRLQVEVPDPARFTALVDDLAPRAPTKGRFGLAELAVRLARTDASFRSPAESAIHGADFSRFMVSLRAAGDDFTGDDLLWWYGLFVRELRSTPAHDTLMQKNAAFLLRHLPDDVLGFLLAEGANGPGGCVVDSYAHALIALGDCPPLEHQWSRWIQDGLFDNGTSASESPRVLAACLSRMIDRGVPAGAVLLAETVRHWRSLLTDPDEIAHRRLARTIWYVLAGGAVVADQVVLGDPVLAALEHDLVPDARRVGLPEAGTIGALVVATRWAARAGTDEANREQSTLVHRMFEEIKEQELRFPDLPWRRAR